MAIEPQKLYRKIRDKEREKTKYLEERIDIELEEKYDAKTPVKIEIDKITDNLTNHVICEMIERYKSVGWQVQLVRNQPRKDYLNFVYDPGNRALLI